MVKIESTSMRYVYDNVEAIFPGWAWLGLGEPFFAVASGPTDIDGEPLGDVRGLIGSVCDSIAL